MSETVSAERRITQIIAQWVPGSWASNSKCPTPIRAETVSRHNEVMTPGRTKTSSTGYIRDWNAVVRQIGIKYRGALWWRKLCTTDTSLNFTGSGTSSQWRSTCISCLRHTGALQSS